MASVTEKYINVQLSSFMSIENSDIQEKHTSSEQTDTTMTTLRNSEPRETEGTTSGNGEPSETEYMAQSPEAEEKWRRSTAENELQTVKEIYRELFETNTSPRYFDLEAVNSEGRKKTVLHCLTKTIGTVPEEKETCLKMFDDFISMASEWWKKKFHADYPDISDTDAKYLAVKKLTTKITDYSLLTVLDQAFKYEAVEVVQRLMLMENVNCVIEGKRKRYDISYMTPKTSGLTICECSITGAGMHSCLELLSNNPSVRANEILELEPLKKLERIYNSITSRIYWVMALIHVLYMAVFSYSSCDLLLQRNLNTSSDFNMTSSSSSMESLFYVIVPLEPIVVFIYLVYNVFKCVSFKSGFYVTFCFKNCCVHSFVRFSKIILTVFYIVIVCVSIKHYQVNSPMKYYTISLSLLLGWLFTFFFTRGVRTLHFFLKVIYEIILADVLKVMFVYLFFILAFSLAIHVQFLSSPTIIATYQTPIHTIFLMFNVMMGMGDQLVDPDIERDLENAGLAPLYIKLLYTVYVLFVPIVLLNLLIAVMNISYTRILDSHSLVLLGIAVERDAPCLANLCGNGTIHHGKMFANSSIVSEVHEEEVWYIKVKTTDKGAQDCDDVDGIELDVLEQSEDMQVLTERIQMMEGRLGNIESLLEA